MADFAGLLNASPEELVRIFYRVKDAKVHGFVAKIDHVASSIGLNHSQLICGLGFNKHLEELVDILSVLGFSSGKLLKYRRDELFAHDIYDRLSIDDILDIYTHCLADQNSLTELEPLLPLRINNIESSIEDASDPAIAISYKMELHAIYSSQIASTLFAEQRILMKKETKSSGKMWLEEIRLITENQVIPASNLFFSEDLTPEEKLMLIESGEINVSMIKNRMQNTDITTAERNMLEDKLN